MKVRQYGSSGPWVVVLHGGPGAGGYMDLLAHGLEASFRVLEPIQRGSGGAPLTVEVHVADLDDLVRRRCGDEPPALVGHSWGAMLALAYAAAYPRRVGSLVLISCGTFDAVSRSILRTRIEARMDSRLRRRVEHLSEEFPEADERLEQLGKLMLPVFSHDLAVSELRLEACDARAHDEAWQDMLRLQELGVYPTAFAAIEVPVLMLHGSVDPHPGSLIREALRPYLRQIEYREWERCGHYPWLERGVQDEFVAVLRRWLAKQSGLEEPGRTKSQ